MTTTPASRNGGLTAKQKEQLLRVARLWLASESWARAENHGQRVTLASLHSRGLLERRARRGSEGEADAAYEYRITPTIERALRERSAASNS